jgi:hypothetical protein
MVDKPRATIRMRELRFWHDFYVNMRGARVRDGVRIANALGLQAPVIGPHLAKRLDEMSEVPDELLEDIQRRNKAESTPPDAAYNQAKERAMELMRLAA